MAEKKGKLLKKVNGTEYDLRIVLSNDKTIEETINDEAIKRANNDNSIISNLNAHKNNNLLDHPNGSVVDEKIGERQIEDPTKDINTTSGFITSLFNRFTMAIRDLRKSFNDYINTVKVTIDGKEDKINKGVSNGYAGLDSNTKLLLENIPDFLFGQVLYAGIWDASTSTAILTSNAKSKLGAESETIVLSNDTNAVTGFAANEGNYFITNISGTFASTTFDIGDWLISTGNSWQKIDNTDAVTGVKGDFESSYRIGNINISKTDIGLSNVQNIDTTNASNIITGKMSPERVTQDSSNRFVTDSQIINWNAGGDASNAVMGIKGNNESNYRSGYVNLTYSNLGVAAISNGGTGATDAASAKINLALNNVTNESKTTMFNNASLTGTPTAPTAAANTNSTQIATTAFVKTAIDTNGIPSTGITWGKLAGK